MTNRLSPTLNERAAADYIGLAVRTLQKRRFEQQGPPYLKIGRSVRYRLEDLDIFLNSHRVTPAHSTGQVTR